LTWACGPQIRSAMR